MALNNTQANVATEMQNLAMILLEARPRLEAVLSLWASELMADLTDEEFQELTEFAHVTTAEMVGARNAMNDITAEIADYSLAANNASKLLKIVNKVPS